MGYQFPFENDDWRWPPQQPQLPPSPQAPQPSQRPQGAAQPYSRPNDPYGLSDPYSTYGTYDQYDQYGPQPYANPGRQSSPYPQGAPTIPSAPPQPSRYPPSAPYHPQPMPQRRGRRSSSARPPGQRRSNGPVLLEFFFGLFGLFGVGWLAGRRTTIGLLLMVVSALLYAVWVALVVGSLGIGVLCVVPANLTILVISALSLNAALKRPA